jgi:hypothetical protein
MARMAAESRRQLWLLAILSVGLIGALWWQLSPDQVPAPVPTTRAVQAAASRRGAAAAAGAAVEAVHLDALTASRTKPDEGTRDPFRFNAPAPPPPKAMTPVAGPGGAPGSLAPMAPAAPTGPPPMLLKFIGILKPTSTAPIAVLTDGKNVFYGREGETIEGRYRIERIGVESVDMAWADGQGHQVIRLSGS